MANNRGRFVWSFESLKDYLDQRFRDIEDKAVLRAQTVANQAIEAKAQELLAREIFNQFAGRAELEFKRSDQFLQKENFDAHSDRIAEDLKLARDEVKINDRRVTDIQSKMADNIASLKNDLLGKEAFITYSLHNEKELGNIRTELREYKEPKYATWVAFIGVLFLMIGGLYGIVIKPLQAEMENAKKAISQVDTLSSNIASINHQLDHRFDDFQNQLKSLEQLLISSRK